MEARQILAEHKTGTLLDESYGNQVENKWAELLEGIEEKVRRRIIAMLYENQAKNLRGMNEETRAANVGSFTKHIFPLVREVFARIIAPNIVSVQPMSGPVGAVFNLDYKYGDSKGAATSGDVMPNNFSSEYSSESLTDEDTGVGGSGAAATYTLQLAWLPIKATTTLTLSIDAHEFVITTADAIGTSTAGITPSSLSINRTSGFIQFTIAETLAAATGNWLVSYTYDGEMSSNVPSVNLDLTMTTVTAVARRLKALWSPEASEDLMNLHGVTLESELVSAIATEIALEIDREILADIRNNATLTTQSWAAQRPGDVPLMDHLMSLVASLTYVSNQVHRKTRRGPANFMFTSPDLSALLEILPGFVPAPGDPHERANLGIQRVGRLQGKWDIYKDPLYPLSGTSGTAVLGYNGAGVLDAGYVYAPYVPLEVTPTFLDPSDMSFKKGMRTRYAKQLLRQNYYATLTVTNLSGASSPFAGGVGA